MIVSSFKLKSYKPTNRKLAMNYYTNENTKEDEYDHNDGVSDEESTRDDKKYDYSGDGVEKENTHMEVDSNR